MDKLAQSTCPFCTFDLSRIILSYGSAMAIMDGFPVSPGHALIIPRRHIASLFDATSDEREALLELLSQVKIDLQKKYKPDGFNIGINEGSAAGQTIMHLHIHLIPRYSGDMPDPRGGIRWIFPEKAAYWN